MLWNAAPDVGEGTGGEGMSWEELNLLKEAQIILERLAGESENEIYQAAADYVGDCVDRWETKP